MKPMPVMSYENSNLLADTDSFATTNKGPSPTKLMKTMKTMRPSAPSPTPTRPLTVREALLAAMEREENGQY